MELVLMLLTHIFFISYTYGAVYNFHSGIKTKNYGTVYNFHSGIKTENQNPENGNFKKEGEDSIEKGNFCFPVYFAIYCQGWPDISQIQISDINMDISNIEYCFTETPAK